MFVCLSNAVYVLRRTRKCAAVNPPAGSSSARSGTKRKGVLSAVLCSCLLHLLRGKTSSFVRCVYIRVRSLQNSTGPPRLEEGMEPHGRDDPKGPVLHIVVVGFHHKKGCQVGEPLLCAS